MRILGFEEDLHFGCVQLIPHRSTVLGVCENCGDVWKTNYELDCNHYLCQGCVLKCEQSAWCAMCSSWNVISSTFVHEEEMLRRQRAVCYCGQIATLKDMMGHFRICQQLVSVRIVGILPQYPGSTATNHQIPVVDQNIEYTPGILLQPKTEPVSPEHCSTDLILRDVTSQLSRLEEDICSAEKRIKLEPLDEHVGSHVSDVASSVDSGRCSVTPQPHSAANDVTHKAAPSLAPVAAKEAPLVYHNSVSPMETSTSPVTQPNHSKKLPPKGNEESASKRLKSKREVVTPNPREKLWRKARQRTVLREVDSDEDFRAESPEWKPTEEKCPDEDPEEFSEFSPRKGYSQRVVTPKYERNWLGGVPTTNFPNRVRYMRQAHLKPGTELTQSAGPTSSPMKSSPTALPRDQPAESVSKIEPGQKTDLENQQDKLELKTELNSDQMDPKPKSGPHKTEMMRFKGVRQSIRKYKSNQSTCATFSKAFRCGQYLLIKLNFGTPRDSDDKTKASVKVYLYPNSWRNSNNDSSILPIKQKITLTLHRGERENLVKEIFTFEDGEAIHSCFEDAKAKRAYETDLILINLLEKYPKDFCPEDTLTISVDCEDMTV